MAGEIIRQGDPTSHGGKVLEGSAFDICHGKPISFIGHKVACPRCKGIFPIVEGAQTTTFYGQGVALAGMKTACGAVLIATQFLDTVEYGGGSSAAGRQETATSVGAPAQSDLVGQGMADKSANKAAAHSDTEEEHFYTLADASGNPAEGYRYDLHCDGALHTQAGSYVGGATASVTSPSRLVSWLAKDGASKS